MRLWTISTQILRTTGTTGGFSLISMTLPLTRVTIPATEDSHVKMIIHHFAPELTEDNISEALVEPDPVEPEVVSIPEKRSTFSGTAGRSCDRTSGNYQGSEDRVGWA